jgi:hypothetical protein
MPFEDKRNRRNRLFWGLAPHLPALGTRRNFLDVPAGRADIISSVVRLRFHGAESIICPWG